MADHSFSYDAHARTCDEQDFLRQIRRTVNGEPISDAQIQMIVEKIKSSLALDPTDHLAEIGCGNGFISNFFFQDAGYYYGTDISEYLIYIAKKYFEQENKYEFHQASALEFVNQYPAPEKFTKFLCYAVFQYFSVTDATALLSGIRKKFPNVEILFIGNIPDRTRCSGFFKQQPPSEEELDRVDTAIGRWWDPEAFSRIAGECGWKAEISLMPAEFPGHAYRFDAKLSRL